MHRLTLEEVIQPNRPRLGPQIPLATFRLLRLLGMQEILGNSTGPTLYMVGTRVGKMLPVDSVDSFLQWIEHSKIGLPTIVDQAANSLIVQVEECINCSGLPHTGEFYCQFESGLIAGAISKITGRQTKATQTKSISNGDPLCWFELDLF